MVTPAQKTTNRAKSAYKRIMDKPTTITFRKPMPPGRPATLSPQTLRVEVGNRAGLATSEAGSAPIMGVTVYGWRGHPSYPDSDIAEGYTFNLNGDTYRIQDVILTLGEVQGTGVRTG